MITFFSKLETRIREINSLLCIGLDPHPSELSELTGTAAKTFCARIIEATADFAAAYKPNAAFFEALGPDGIAALQEVIVSIPNGIPVILDAKRGDISSTAQAYAKAAFDRLGADALTINPYLGKDSVEPFIGDPEKGVFLLCKTSNPGATDLQDLEVADRRVQGPDVNGQQSVVRLFEYVARLADAWNINDNLGLVVGATQPESLACVREAAPNLWILAPGVGAQGGDLSLALKAGLRTDGLGMLIPVSRGISRAASPRDAAIAIRDTINQQRTSLHTQQTEFTPTPFSNSQALIADGLLEADCIKFGSFTLKSGVESPIYIDLRRLVGYPNLLSRVGEAYAKILVDLQFDLLAALPYAALPITSTISFQMGLPMVYPRKEVKAYGTKSQVEGVFEVGQKAVVIDDLISTGGSKFEGIRKLEFAGLDVDDVVVLIDRSSDGGAELIKSGCKLHSVLQISDLLTYYEQKGIIDSQKIADVRNFLKK